MPLPQLDDRGFLPAGCHSATWDEVRQMFCVSGHRRSLMRNFHRFIESELRAVGDGLPLIIAGSFLSDKVTPGDIETSIYLPNDQIAQRAGLCSIGSKVEHIRIKKEYGADFYVTFDLAGQPNFYDFFQYVGPKSASKKGLNEKDRRGIIEVTPW
ncbi:hypothetical protein [Pseudomonas sp. 91RF]|uniref:DUF6932 family protein n=1 Tax=Pseudomonas sp. 91RF TaxID=2292261 RepID=UPI0011C42C65|nr:hypothetical protein [Pseudomonas sp. 91RF]